MGVRRKLDFSAIYSVIPALLKGRMQIEERVKLSRTKRFMNCNHSLTHSYSLFKGVYSEGKSKILLLLKVEMK